MTDDTTVQMPQAWKLDIDIYESRMLRSEYGDWVEIGDVSPLVDEINRLRARVQVLEREVERLEQKSEKDWKWFSDATGM